MQLRGLRTTLRRQTLEELPWRNTNDLTQVQNNYNGEDPKDANMLFEG